MRINRMDDFWEVLNIEGNLDEAEILFSKLKIIV